MNRFQKTVLILGSAFIIFALAGLLYPQERIPSPPLQKQNSSVRADVKKDTPEEGPKFDNKDLAKLPPKGSYEEMFMESQRNLDRSVAILTLSSTLLSVLLGLLTISVAIAVAFGFFQGRKLKKIIKKAHVSAYRIESLQKDTEKRSKEFAENIQNPKVAEVPSELKGKMEDLSHRIEFLEALGFSLSPADHFVRGNALFEKKEYLLAVEAYNKTIESEPNNTFAWNNKASALSRMGRYEEANDAYKKAIELRPKSIMLINNCGVNLIKMGPYQEALDTFNKLLEINPDDPDGYFNKACAYAAMRNKVEALKFLSRAIALNAGFREKAKTDEDFKTLWEDADFKSLTQAPRPEPPSPV